VIPSKLTVLTSVGLDHTEWLGETLEEIATEKLAVLRDHTRLLVGNVPPEIAPVIKREAERHHVEPYWAAGGPGYQAQNLAVASAAASEVADGIDSGAVAGTEWGPDEMMLMRSIPGRAEVVPGDPPLIFDAAHNPAGARALAELLPDLIVPRDVRHGLRKRLEPHEVICCLAILAEKDAEGIIGALAPACSHFVCTQIPEEAIRGSGRPVGTSYSASELADLCRRAGAEAEAVDKPIDAWKRARELAGERDAAALAAGSHYLLSCLWTERPAPSS
jgi:dihydrofolate synthase/folylpolyglutamate synthase